MAKKNKPEYLNKMVLPQNLNDVIKNSNAKIILPETKEELIDLAMGGKGRDTNEVSFEVNGETIREGTVVKCKNGIVINFDDPAMRRRDPNSMVIADDLPTDKPTHMERFGKPFEPIRMETFEWLKSQESLIVVPFYAGNVSMGICYPCIAVVPGNAAFFAAALAELQGFVPGSKLPNFFKPKAVIYVAPTFRHTHYDGKQIVVHNRLYDLQEVFSYNLYLGPSAKKGVYSILLDIGEREGWVTLHASSPDCNT